MRTVVGGKNRGVRLSRTLLLVVLLLITLPLLLVQFLLSTRSLQNVEQVSRELTNTILKASLESLHGQLEELEDDIVDTLREVEGLDGFDEHILEHLQDDLTFEELLLWDLQSRQGVAIDSSGAAGPASTELAASDSVSILRSLPGRFYWLGKPLFLDDSETGLWFVGTLDTAGTLLLAIRFNLSYVTRWIDVLARDTASDVYLLTVDNTVFGGDPQVFFRQPFALRVMDRSLQGDFIDIRSRKAAEDGGDDVLVRAYTEPDHLFTLVAVTPRRILTGIAQRALKQTQIFTLLIGIFGIASVAGLILLFFRNINRILISLDNLAEGRSVDVIVGEGVGTGIREFTHIRDRLVRVSEILRNREVALIEARDNLEKTVADRTEELRKSQGSLVESEKMAALGRTVAVFTHDINTPMGVGVTASTHLESLLVELQRLEDRGEEAGEDRQRLIADSLETARLINRNLSQAVGITRSLKHLAVDQGRSESQIIRLTPYVREVAASLATPIKSAGARIDIDGDDQVSLECDPAIIYQIFSNLINNSLIHGFEGRVGNAISIRIDRGGAQGELCDITYVDNGKGMNETQIQRIYEPFFTTRSEKGGTGLGMNVVYTLITRDLAGRIICESSPGHGVRFHLSFPGCRTEVKES